MSGADSTPFTIQAQPATDIWKKPPSTNIFNAPIRRTSTGLLSKFRSARVTFWADWHERYDQGGLLLVPRRRSSSAPPPYDPAEPPAQWIKTGVELYQVSEHTLSSIFPLISRPYYSLPIEPSPDRPTDSGTRKPLRKQGAPQLSTVSTDRFADWSVSPLGAGDGPSDVAKRSVTIEIAREGDENGKSVWVYQIVRGGSGAETRIPLREICWIFADEEDGDNEWVLDVSPLAARPEKKATAPLEVRFEEFTVEWAA
ncbi:hypothetical protein SLS62_009523 [Diatrype stigma]|uniref:Uncharacterized protein n=1 Tax=Diatrype stigma TaxID=117547 RepID=A0AAN9UL02_9PEZI